MIRFVRGTALAVALAGILFLAACGGDSSPSPSASSTTADPVAQLSGLAYDVRSTESPTQAWWVLMPRSEVDKLQGMDIVSPHPSPDTPTYVALINGNWTDGDKHYTWVIAFGSPKDSTVFFTDKRPDTGSRAWTSLPLASP